VTVAGILISNIKDVGQRWRGPSWKTWLVSGYAAQASTGASAAQVLVGCHCISASLASQTISHALTGRVSKYMYLTSYSRLLIPPLLYVAHTLHTSTNSPPLSQGQAHWACWWPMRWSPEQAGLLPKKNERTNG